MSDVGWRLWVGVCDVFIVVWWLLFNCMRIVVVLCVIGYDCHDVWRLLFVTIRVLCGMRWVIAVGCCVLRMNGCLLMLCVGCSVLSATHGMTRYGVFFCIHGLSCVGDVCAGHCVCITCWRIV